MDIPEQININFPGKLVFGNGSLAQLAEEVANTFAKKVLIITISPLVLQLQDIIKEISSRRIDVLINTTIINEPTFADFKTLYEEVEEFNPDVVIGVGGGSVLDVAKLIAAQLDNDQTLYEYVGIGLLKQRKKKLICLPATAGTGSEVSPNAILLDEDNQKKGIISQYLVPDLVIVDPLLTLSVPPAITAATGLDALTHCLEAYTNKFAHPLIDMYALRGIQLIAGSLVEAVKNGSNKEARSNVAMGSLLGGFCLGPVNTAAVHALSYPLGSMFHLAHGLSNALLLPYVIEYNLPASPAKYADVAVALGCEKHADDVITAKKGIEKIRLVISQCGIPSRLREVNIPKEVIPGMAANALKIQRLLKNNPRLITEADAIEIYNAAY
ncbi:MAG: iron-containing alcohol dehydrogenase [Candidatus Dadabacteria bacterium]